MIRICIQCNKSREVSEKMKYHLGTGKCLSCSTLGNKNRLGYKYVMSQETKDKIRLTKVGKPFSGKSFDWTGKRRSDETRKKMSVASIGSKKSHQHVVNMGNARRGIKRPDIAGEKNYRWIVDRSKVKIGDRGLHDPRYKQWHMGVKNRDKWTCRIADVNCDGRLEAHHILPWKNFPELRYEVKNGITLCHHHHPTKRMDVEKLSPYFQQLVASSDQNRKF